MVKEEKKAVVATEEPEKEEPEKEEEETEVEEKEVEMEAVAEGVEVTEVEEKDVEMEEKDVGRAPRPSWRPTNAWECFWCRTVTQLRLPSAFSSLQSVILVYALTMSSAGRGWRPSWSTLS